MKEKHNHKVIKKLAPYIMVGPSMLIFFVFAIIPIFYMLYISFFKWNMVGSMKFIGIDNYVNMFKDVNFRKSLLNTIKYMFIMVPVTMALSMAIAVYLKTNNWINRLIQNVMFLPHIVSLVSISFIWMWIMDSNRGLLNYVISLFGIEPIGWLSDPKYAMTSLVIMNVWKILGYYVLILVAALQGIPSHLYEAAALDKASKWRVFFKITLPMLSPTLFFLTLTGIIGSFKTFESVQLMTGGGPQKSTTTLVYELYQQGFVYYKTGYASAMGVVLMLIVGVMTLIYFTVLQKKVHYQ